MTRVFAGTIIAAVLAVTPSLAQSTAPNNPPASAPSMSTPGKTGSGTEASANNSGNTSAGGSSTGTAVMTADDVMASRLIGSSIRNTANESIGDVNDLVLDNTGKVKAVIAGVGGFLGIGEQNVALQFDQLKMTRDASGNTYLTSSLSRDQLRTLPKWQDQRSSPSSRAR